MVKKTTKAISLDPILRRWAEDNLDNFSSWVEVQIRGLKEMHDNPTESEKQISELQEDIASMQKEVRSLENNISLKISRIQELKQKKDKEMTELLDKAKREGQSIRNSGMLGRLGL